MKRENLILVNSYPTNHETLKGLVEYMNQFFKVHFIDLPGFHPDTPPVKENQLRQLHKILRERNKKTQLEKILSGWNIFRISYSEQRQGGQKMQSNYRN